MARTDSPFMELRRDAPRWCCSWCGCCGRATGGGDANNGRLGEKGSSNGAGWGGPDGGGRGGDGYITVSAADETISGEAMAVSLVASTAQDSDGPVGVTAGAAAGAVLASQG